MASKDMKSKTQDRTIIKNCGDDQIQISKGK